MTIKIEKTERGFYQGNFVDRYGKECSIQESSLATESAIWFGCNEGTHTIDEDGKTACMGRMHLTQDMVAQLIPLLDIFVYEGHLPHPPDMYEAWVNARVEVGDKIELREVCLGEYTREDGINVLLSFARKHFGKESHWNGYVVEIPRVPEMRGYNGGFLHKAGESKR